MYHQWIVEGSHALLYLVSEGLKDSPLIIILITYYFYALNLYFEPKLIQMAHYTTTLKLSLV